MSFPIVILGSGRGSNAKALLEAEARGALGNAQTAAIFSDVEDAGILSLGDKFNVPSRFIKPQRTGGYLAKEAELEYIKQIKVYQPRLIVLAGFMRILRAPFINAFDGRVINLHPSLLPSFKGATGIADAFEYGVKITGCTVHWVTPALDAGPILDQTAVQIESSDTLDSLSEKIHAAEHALLPKVIAELSQR